MTLPASMTLVLALQSKWQCMFQIKKTFKKYISIPSKTQIKLFAKIKSIHGVITMWVNRYYGKTNQIKSFFPTLLSSAYILNINFGENTVICRVTKSQSCRTHHTSFTTTVPTVTQQTSFNQSARAGAVSSSSDQIRPASLGSQTRSYLHKTPIGVHGHSQPGIP